MAMAYYGGYNNYKLQRKPPNLLNSIFISTMNMATKMLLSVASNNYTNFTTNNNGLYNKWKAKDHLRFMFLLFTWFTMWALRVVNDYLPFLSPFSLLPSPSQSQSSDHHDYNHQLRQKQYQLVDNGDHEGSSSTVGSSSCRDLVPSSSSSYSHSNVHNLDLLPHDGFLMMDGVDHQHQGQSVQALGRALSHILALLNELPATSRKYEFAMAMADRILDENTRDDRIELLQVNRAALSSAFECTTNLLYHTLNNAAMSYADQANASGAWTHRVIRKLPLGSYITAYMKGGLSAVFPALDSMWQLQKRRRLVTSSSSSSDSHGEHVGSDQSGEVVGAEKLVQELLWITHKLRACRAVDEALVQWSFASGVASLSLNANPRVQALLIKLSASLFEDVARARFEVPTQVQYRLLVLWLPLFCYASTTLRYPVLSSYEKIEVERTIDRMIELLPAMEQEIVLRNWLQDFALCSSDWPNLRPSYDRWCQFSRQVVA